MVIDPGTAAIAAGGISAGSDLLGGLMGSSASKKAAQFNADLQKEFAWNGIRWRVEDAKAAGIHPLYALGAQTTSFSPIPISTDSMSTAMHGMGQDISRAMLAKATADERHDNTIGKLAVRRAELENQLLESQIAKTNAQLPPPLPSDTPWREAPSIPTVNFGHLPDGGITAVPSQDFTDRTEDDFISKIEWSIRNKLLPFLQTPRFQVDNGKTYQYDRGRSAYYPYNPKNNRVSRFYDWLEKRNILNGR